MKSGIRSLRNIISLSVLYLLIIGNALAERKAIQYGPVKLMLEASSVLPSSKVVSYEPENVLDENAKTAWIEGQKGTEGARITFKFGEIVEFCGFEYIPGYAKNKEIYKSNSIPDRILIDAGVKQCEVMPFLKKRLTGFDPEIDDEPANEIDFNDKENYTYQYVILNPTVTQKVSVTIAWAEPAKFEDTGFSELHPIYRFRGVLYCGQKRALKLIEMIATGESNAKFTPVIQISSKDVKAPGFNLTWDNRVGSKDVKSLKASEMTPSQKRLFFPYGESFRLYMNFGGARVISLIDYGFHDCDSAYGILKRQIYLVTKNKQWYFNKIEYQDELWKE